jgi:hypothetical protein
VAVASLALAAVALSLLELLLAWVGLYPHDSRGVEASRLPQLAIAIAVFVLSVSALVISIRHTRIERGLFALGGAALLTAVWWVVLCISVEYDPLNCSLFPSLVALAPAIATLAVGLRLRSRRSR